jgi:hypothetical protein
MADQVVMTEGTCEDLILLLMEPAVDANWIYQLIDEANSHNSEKKMSLYLSGEKLAPWLSCCPRDRLLDTKPASAKPVQQQTHYPQ